MGCRIGEVGQVDVSHPSRTVCLTGHPPVLVAAAGSQGKGAVRPGAVVFPGDHLNMDVNCPTSSLMYHMALPSCRPQQSGWVTHLVRSLPGRPLEHGRELSDKPEVLLPAHAQGGKHGCMRASTDPAPGLSAATPE